MGAFRLILAFAVVLEHTAYSGPRLMRGFEAVHIFFLISGFYMCMVLRRKYGYSGDGIRAFYINRFLRLYPTYFLALCATMAWYGICRWSSEGTGSEAAIMELGKWLSPIEWAGLWVANFTLVGVDLPAWFNVLAGGGVQLAGAADAPVKGGSSGMYWLGYGLWVGPSWTIGCEIWFYGLAPLVLSKRVWLRITGAGALSAALAVVFGRDFLHGGYYIWFFWFWCFALGMVAYLVYERFEANLQRAFDSTRGGIAITGMALCLAFFTIPFILDWNVPFWVVMVVAVPAVPFLFHATKNSEPDRLLGEFSYPVYCVHMLAAEFNQTLIGVFKINWEWLVWMNILTTLAFSAVCVFFIEKPFEKIRAAIGDRVAR